MCIDMQITDFRYLILLIPDVDGDTGRGQLFDPKLMKTVAGQSVKCPAIATPGRRDCTWLVRYLGWDIGEIIPGPIWQLQCPSDGGLHMAAMLATLLAGGWPIMVKGRKMVEEMVAVACRGKDIEDMAIPLRYSQCSHISSHPYMHVSRPPTGQVDSDDLPHSVTAHTPTVISASKRAAAVVLELPATSSRSVCMARMACLHGPHSLQD